MQGVWTHPNKGEVRLFPQSLRGVNTTTTCVGQRLKGRQWVGKALEQQEAKASGIPSSQAEGGGSCGWANQKHGILGHLRGSVS